MRKMILPVSGAHSFPTRSEIRELPNASTIDVSSTENTGYFDIYSVGTEVAGRPSREERQGAVTNARRKNRKHDSIN
jgi:hypothetical protein